MQRRSGTWRTTLTISSVSASSTVSVSGSMFQSVRSPRAILRMWWAEWASAVRVMRYWVGTGGA
ncbi:hypothetical protein ASE41_36015 [Streptomyces sp. Root264]|nr:hypothetical protein ASE41_36015 [Streptomyces sp. Root264]